MDPKKRRKITSSHHLSRNLNNIDSLKGKFMQHSENNTYTSILSRIPLYIVGAFLLGFGIVLCVKCEMGVSPINSIPYVTTHFIPLSLGILSIFFYLINITVELILSEKNSISTFSCNCQYPCSLVWSLIFGMPCFRLPETSEYVSSTCAEVCFLPHSVLC